MLQRLRNREAASDKSLALDIEIAAVATAAPPNSIGQQELKEHILAFYPQFAHWESIYNNTGIATRHYCETPGWYLAPRNWEERSAAFERHGLDLLERVAVDALDQAGLGIEEIDALVVNSTTGIAVPSLDALLMNRLGFSPNVERTPLFGLGCGAGVAGLSRASRIAAALPDSNVLFLTVELCTLCRRIDDPKAAAFVAGALFGDGAAGVVLRHRGSGDANGAPGRVRASGEHFWRDTRNIMGWDIANDGFGVVLSASLPALIEERLPEAMQGFLDRHEIARHEIDGYLIHPGGAKVLDVVTRVLALPADALAPSRHVLSRFGNMSSATVLFVLRETIAAGRRGRHLAIAFGPGFSVYFAVIDL